MNAHKYAKLADFLSTNGGTGVTLSFADIERVLGFSLPESAKLHPAWWSNRARSWRGWRAHPRLRAESVTFDKSSDPATPLSAQRAQHMVQGRSPEHELEEEQVKQHLRSFLETNGWQANVVVGKAHGVDVDAFREGRRWMIEVKGCGSLNAMRVNYFLGAIGELLQRMNDPGAKYSLAFPDLAQFRGLWERLPRLAKDRTRISCLFVTAAGKVSELN